MQRGEGGERNGREGWCGACVLVTVERWGEAGGGRRGEESGDDVTVGQGCGRGISEVKPPLPNPEQRRQHTHDYTMVRRESLYIITD